MRLSAYPSSISAREPIGRLGYRTLSDRSLGGPSRLLLVGDPISLTSSFFRSSSSYFIFPFISPG
jgi:hypothetical protein